MGVGLNSMQKVTGALTGAALAVASVKDTVDKKAAMKDLDKKSGIDAKMAAKARLVAQQKIKAIYQNKELSEKARTRRMGKVIDEYQKVMGGNK